MSSRCATSRQPSGTEVRSRPRRHESPGTAAGLGRYRGRGRQRALRHCRFARAQVGDATPGVGTKSGSDPRRLASLLPCQGGGSAANLLCAPRDSGSRSFLYQSRRVCDRPDWGLPGAFRHDWPRCPQCRHYLHLLKGLSVRAFDHLAHLAPNSKADHAKRSAGKSQPSVCANCSRPDQHDHVCNSPWSSPSRRGVFDICFEANTSEAVTCRDRSRNRCR